MLLYILTHALNGSARNRRDNMTTKQVKALRNKINAAWAANDRATADKLQAKLHDHFAAAADKFLNSAAGAAWGGYIVDRP